jgi:hypothetical protein
VNAGGPLPTPLRALRRPPVLVDDLGTLPRLISAARALPAGSALGDPEELVRWTRAWLIAWQGAYAARGLVGHADPWTVALPLTDLPSLKGDPDRRRQHAALALLTRADLLALTPDGAAATLGEAAFVAHRAGLELAWDAIGPAIRFEPAALLVVRALAELVVPPDVAQRVTLRELSARTGYVGKQVRIALRRLAEAGVVRVREAAGAPTQYHFADAFTSRGDVARATPPRGPRADQATPALSPAPPIAPAAAATDLPLAERSVALRMTLNGVTLSIGPGMTPYVELGPDGVPHVRFDPPVR